MSFTSDTKECLSGLRLKESERRPLLLGITGAIGVVIIRHGLGIGIKYATESANVSNLISKLALEQYSIEADVSVHENNSGINSKTMVVCLFGENVRALAHDSMIMTSHVPFDLLEEERQRRAYLRGVFLACGHVTDPKKAYHLECVLKTQGFSEDILTLADSMGLSMKSAKRREHFLVYAKDSDVICDTLTLMGASESTLEFESVRAYKDTRNYANRTRNCDVANIERSAAAASAQLEALKRVIDSGVELPERLRATAQARINNEDATLAELAQILGIGKSGVYHRMQRLMDMAQELEMKGD